MPDQIADIQRPGYLAPDRLARTWHQIQEAKRIVGMIEQEIKDLSFREVIDLGDGNELGPRERKVEELTAEVVRDVMIEMLGAEYADAAVTLEVTKAAIEEQAKRHRDKHPKDAEGKRVVLESRKNGDGLLDRIYAEVRRQGGSQYKVTNYATVYKRKLLQ